MTVRRRARSHVDEAGDGLETTVLGDRPTRFPREARTRSLWAANTRQAETMRRKALLDALDHHVDAVVAIAAVMRIT